MPDYKATTIAGTAYTRAHQAIVANPVDGVKAISFYEEQIVNLGDEQIHRPQGGIQEPLTADNLQTEFQLLNPVDSTELGLTMTYQDVYVALHSLYLHLATKRDAAVAAAAEAAALAAAVVPAEPEPEVTPEA